MQVKRNERNKARDGQERDCDGKQEMDTRGIEKGIERGRDRERWRLKGW